MLLQKKPNKKTSTQWPLRIIRKDGQIEEYNTYEDFVQYSNRKIITRETICYRNRVTRKKGSFRGEQWLLLHYDEWHAMFPVENFTCAKCNQLKEIMYYDTIDNKMLRNYIVYKLNDDESEKHCMDCMRIWAREVINQPPLYPRVKSLLDYYEEVRLEKEQQSKKKRTKNGENKSRFGRIR